MTDNRKLYFIQNFGDNVAKLRKEKNIKQEVLAEYVGISKNAISKIEQGTSYPTFANLDKIAEFFKATPTQLFGTEQEKQLEISADNIDEYQKKAHEILQANKAFNDLYSQFFELEQGRGDYIFEQTVNTLQNLKPFMFGRTVGVLDENNDYVFDLEGRQEIRYIPPLLDSLDLDEINELYEKIKFIVDNQDKIKQ
ncbi:transcriptional regulator [Bacilli bacterium]|nr:transcriptional regulator [Bacilli bacterium]